MAVDPLLSYITNPRETLETEYKDWLDITDTRGAESADLAQAIIAIANHGGGQIVIGFVTPRPGGLRYSPRQPADIHDAYSTDRVNAVVLRYADPAFHVDVRFVTAGDTHPVLLVPGGHRVPIMAKRDGPNSAHVRQLTVYIRRPGPQSAPPQNANDWRDLFERITTRWVGERPAPPERQEPSAQREGHPSVEERMSDARRPPAAVPIPRPSGHCVQRTSLCWNHRYRTRS